VLSALAAHVSSDDAAASLPAVIQRPEDRPRDGETWDEFKHRIGTELNRLNDVAAGGRARPLFLANALAGSFAIEQFQGLADLRQVDMIELDPVVNATLMDDVFPGIGTPALRERNRSRAGRSRRHSRR
jgi:hypothetical protein